MSFPVTDTHPPSISAAAKIYGCSRQNLAALRQVHGISAAELLSPDRLFEILLEKGTASKLRTRLADPEFRRDAAERLTFHC